MASPKAGYYGRAGVYLIRSSDGRQYIGSAVNIGKRWRNHWRDLEGGKHHNRFMQRAWRKRGRRDFQFSVLLFCDRENLLQYEQACIDAYRPEYNAAPVAGSQLGYRHTKETRARMSASRRKDFSPMKGRKHTAEARAKMSANRKGKGGGPRTPERLAKIAAAMRAAKSVLNEEKVRSIRALNRSGVPHREVAERVGCSYSAVADVVRNRTFKWVI